jgi:hypothetical protein
LPFAIFLYHLYHFLIISSSLSSSLLAPFAWLAPTHHFHFHYPILGTLFPMSLHIYHNNSSSRFVYFLDIKVHYIYKTPVSPSQIFAISVMPSHNFSVTSNLVVSTENSKMKVEWTLLTVLIYKFRCGILGHS